MANKYLYCPIRGELQLTEKNNKNEFTEEFRRIELVKFLLNKGYPKELFGFEKVILKYGNAGRNRLQADLDTTKYLKYFYSNITMSIKIKVLHN